MPLEAPKKTPAGYILHLNPPVKAPALRWNKEGAWEHTNEWVAWADGKRKELLGELLSHGTWFSRPPRHDILDPLFSPWIVKTMQGTWKFNPVPDIPAEMGSQGSATWTLQGLLMTTCSISPLWKIEEFEKEDTQDVISLFGDGETVDGSVADLEGDEGREIQFEEIEEAPAETPTHIRSRDWEVHKFLAKERVREARLKAQVAARVAEREEARFYSHFGDLEDTESRFSDYDLTESEGSSSESESEA